LWCNIAEPVVSVLRKREVAAILARRSEHLIKIECIILYSKEGTKDYRWCGLHCPHPLSSSDFGTYSMNKT
jgi:hypothetical protein